MKKEIKTIEKERLTGNQVRPELKKAMEHITFVRDLCDNIHEDDCYGYYFDAKIHQLLNNLTQISLTLGEIYGYTLADDILESREVIKI